MEEPKFIAKLKLTKQGQITLPTEARNELNIENEAELYWYKLNNSLILVKDLVNQKELVDAVLKNKKKRQ